LLLACPVTDLTLAEPSVRTKGHGWGLEADDLRWFAEQWVPDATRRGDPDVSPVHAELSGLPPTVIATAEHDPLRDQGATLARRLREAGVPVRHTNYKGLVHGFVGLSDVSPTAELAGREMFGEFGRLIRARPRAGLRTRPAPTR
jgi:acetyl esterase